MTLKTQSNYKTYGYNIIAWLATWNTLVIHNAAEYEQLVILLNKLELLNILQGKSYDDWKELINHSTSTNTTDICLEYDNNRGITYYTSVEESVKWYEANPFDITDLINKGE